MNTAKGQEVDLFSGFLGEGTQALDPENKKQRGFSESTSDQKIPETQMSPQVENGNRKQGSDVGEKKTAKYKIFEKKPEVTVSEIETIKKNMF